MRRNSKNAYVMLNLTMIYFAVPQIKGFRIVKSTLSLFSIRMMTFSMVFMVLALGIAGVVQAYLQRLLGMDYLPVQGFMKLWYTVFWTSGWGFAIGVLSYIIDFVRMGKLKPVISE